MEANKAQKKETKSGEIIEFPKAKVIQHPKLNEATSKDTFFSVPHRKYLASSLGSALLVAVAFNGMNLANSFSSSKATESRSLASLSEAGKKRNESYEKNLARSLAQPGGRKPASLGNQPSLVEDFQYGFLASKYAVQLHQDKVQSVSFEQGDGSEKPQYIRNRREFMLNKRELWPIQFSSVIEKSKQKDGQKVFEIYSLVSEDQRQVGSVEFELDSYGRLYKMTLVSAFDL